MNIQINMNLRKLHEHQINMNLQKLHEQPKSHESTKTS